MPIPEHLATSTWGPVYAHVNDCDECTAGEPCKEGIQAVQNTGKAVNQGDIDAAKHWVGLIAKRIAAGWE